MKYCVSRCFSTADKEKYDFVEANNAREAAEKHSPEFNPCFLSSFRKHGRTVTKFYGDSGSIFTVFRITK